MYDIPRLRAALPYCEKIDIESHDDQLAGTQKVVVICNYVGGMVARVECPGMPPDTDSMAELVAAAAAQCLAKVAQVGHWQHGKRNRTIKRAGDDGKPWSSGPRISGGPPDGPSPREVALTMQDVIDVDGVETSTSDHQRHHLSTPAKPKALPPKPEKLDEGKVKRASAAMAALLQATGDDDGH